MNPDQFAAQDAFFAALLEQIHQATVSAPGIRAVSKPVISAKADLGQAEGFSGALNANLPQQEALFEFVSCDPRHNNGRHQTAKQRKCD